MRGMTKVDELVSALDEFITMTPGIESAAVVSPDGWPIVSALPDWLDERRLAAMSSALLALGERAVAELGKTGIDHVFVEGVHGQTALMPAGPHAIVAATTYPGARVGLVLYELRKTVAAVEKIMDSEHLVVGRTESHEEILDLTEREHTWRP
jgi:uncharacterized protein